MAGKRNAPSIIPARPPTTNAGRDEDGNLIPHERDEKTAGQVEAMAALGFTDKEIAVQLNLRPGQVRHYYAQELQAGPVKANMQVAKAFLDVAKSGTNWQASQSWLRARAGWKNTEDNPNVSVNVQIVRLGDGD